MAKRSKQDKYREQQAAHDRTERNRLLNAQLDSAQLSVTPPYSPWIDGSAGENGPTVGVTFTAASMQSQQRGFFPDCSWSYVDPPLGGTGTQTSALNYHQFIFMGGDHPRYTRKTAITGMTFELYYDPESRVASVYATYENGGHEPLPIERKADIDPTDRVRVIFCGLGSDDINAGYEKPISDYPKP